MKVSQRDIPFPGQRGDVSTGYALVLHVVRSSEIDVSISMETRHASVDRLLIPPNICYNAYYSHIHARWMTEVQRKYQKMCRQIEECGLMTRQENKRRGRTEGACLMAVPAMNTRPMTSALWMPSTHPAIMNANHRYKYLRRLSMNGPFIFEGYTI